LLSLVVAAVALVAVIGFRAWKASRVTAEERERRRRACLLYTSGPAPHGHHDDAYLSQVDSLLYLLEWRGVVWMELVDMARLPGRYFS